MTRVGAAPARGVADWTSVYVPLAGSPTSVNVLEAEKVAAPALIISLAPGLTRSNRVLPLVASRFAIPSVPTEPSATEAPGASEPPAARMTLPSAPVLVPLPVPPRLPPFTVTVEAVIAPVTMRAPALMVVAPV
jgi:hypothetical protein